MPPRVPASPSVTRDETSTPRDGQPVKNVSTGEGLGHPAAAPRPVPIVERSVTSDRDSRTQRPGEARTPAETDQPAADRSDGSAIIDWLLKTRR